MNPGENDEPMKLPENLPEHIKSRIQEGYDKEGCNVFVSDMISLNRQLPDIRCDICKQKVYKNLPKASIIIIIHNENWMLLIRTIHSIINRTPAELIEEILLVDDASDRSK